MNKVTSKDGTEIAYDKTGEGPALIIVAGALQPRMGNAQLAELLAKNFTVYNYDRRGRGDSGDTRPYAVERELEDLEAVLQDAGGSAMVCGLSSGSNLSLRAVRRGLGITKLALWEPNFVVNSNRPPLPHDYAEQIEKMVADGRGGDAVEYFMTTAVGLPAEFVTPMKGLPMWAGMAALAHTLAYDGRVVGDSMNGTMPEAKEWEDVKVPVLVLDGGTTPWLSEGAAAIAAALPDANRRTLAGQTHDVAPEALAPAITDFFNG